MKTHPEKKFALGHLVITPAALESVSLDDICRSIRRHASGDWGDLEADDHAENELALRIGSRLLSAYCIASGVKIYVLTAPCRTVTTILLPSDN